MRHLHKQGNREVRSGSRRRWSYANIASTLALVLAIGGGSAWAAKHIHYLITSTGQIKPSVVKKLHGANGKNGTNGQNGTNGSNGATGTTGATGATGTGGAVAGFSATFTGNAVIPIGANTGNFVTVVSKTLPAGHYIVNAKVEASSSATAGAVSNPAVETECDLFSGATSLDTSQATVPLSQATFFGAFNTEGATMPLASAVDIGAPTTVSVQCQLKLPFQPQQPAGFAASATNAVIAAVQTSANG